MLDPVALYFAERAARLPWRATPHEFFHSVVAGMDLRDKDEHLYKDLYGVCDDFGNFPAGNIMLASRLGHPRRRPRKSLERLASTDVNLVELYEVGGLKLGHIRGYEQLVGLQRKAVAIWPPRERVGQGPVESPSAQSLVAESPPTPPSSSQQTREARAQSSRARDALRLVPQDAPKPASPAKVAAHAVGVADAKPLGDQVPLQLEEPAPLRTSLERVAVQWLALYALVREQLPAAAQKIPERVVRDKVQELYEQFGVKALREGMRALKDEVGNGTLKWWGNPLGNLERKTRFGWQDHGYVVDEEEAPRPPERAPVVDRADRPAVIDKLQVSPCAGLVDDWKRALAHLQGGVEPWEYKHWLMPIQAAGWLEGRAYLATPDESHSKWIDDNYAERIAEALALVGATMREVVFCRYDQVAT